MKLNNVLAAGVGAVTVGTLAYAYVRLIRPWQLHWGATDEEIARAMPGDGIVTNPHFHATRAITINAIPEDIWPWLVQMGLGKAGWYSYDWLDNLGRPSAERIIPEFQQIKIGDRVPMSKWTYLTVRAFEYNQWLVWQDQSGGTWVWALYPLDEQRTRLVIRMRVCYKWTSPGTILSLPLMELGNPIMIRKELRSIKRRAESLAAHCMVTKRTDAQR